MLFNSFVEIRGGNADDELFDAHCNVASMIKVVERIVVVSVRDSCHNVSELLNNDWINLSIEVYLSRVAYPGNLLYEYIASQDRGMK